MDRIRPRVAAALALGITSLFVSGCIESGPRELGYSDLEFGDTRYVRAPLDSGHGGRDYWRHRRHDWHDRDGACHTPACRSGHRDGMDGRSRDRDKGDHGKGDKNNGDKGKGNDDKGGGKGRNS